MLLPEKSSEGGGVGVPGVTAVGTVTSIDSPANVVLLKAVAGFIDCSQFETLHVLSDYHDT